MKRLIITEEEKIRILNLHSLSEQWPTKDIEDNKYVNIVDVLKLDGLNQGDMLSQDVTNKICTDCVIELSEKTDEFIVFSIWDKKSTKNKPNPVIMVMHVFLKFKKDNNKILLSTFANLKKIANVNINYSDIKDLNFKFDPLVQNVLDATQKTKQYLFTTHLLIGLDDTGKSNYYMIKNNIFKNNIFTLDDVIIYKLGEKGICSLLPNEDLVKCEYEKGMKNEYKYRIENGEIVFYPLKTETSTETTKTEENIVTNFDRKYDYKKDGDKYYYRLKSKPDNWIEATNESAKSAIATLVFKEKSGCVYPKGELCKDWDLENWSDNPEFNSEKVNPKTNIGFCSKHYCTVKYIQDGINDLIENSEYKNTIGHKKLKGYPKLTVDGKFGQNTQNYIYALLGKVSTTPIEFFEQFTQV